MTSTKTAAVCCFCGEQVIRNDTEALEVRVSCYGVATAAASQHFVAHSACLKKALHNRIPFDPGVLME
jgi:hypothetical protein